MTPIVDTHHHLWDLDHFHLPWLGESGPLARSFVMEDYLAATQGLNVVQTVYMEVDVEPSQQVAEAEYVLDLCQRNDNPMVAAVISGRPASGVFESYIRRFADSPYIKGVRQVLHTANTPPGYCLSTEFVHGIRLLGKLGLSFDLCMRSKELADGEKLVAACPETQFILDHCGNPDVQAKNLTRWRRDISALSKHSNVVCKISGIVASAKPGAWTAEDLAPIIHHCVEEFGHDRVMFGGDWPVCTLRATFRQWVEALQQIVADWSQENQRKLFHDNAIRVYGLNGGKLSCDKPHGSG